MKDALHWLETSPAYAANIVHLAGIPAADKIEKEDISIDVMGRWTGELFETVYAYSTTVPGARLAWTKDLIPVLYNRSLALISSALKEMVIPSRVIIFSGIVSAHDKKVRYRGLLVRQTPVKIEVTEPRIWFKKRMWDSDELHAAVDHLFDAKRRLHGMGLT